MIHSKYAVTFKPIPRPENSVNKGKKKPLKLTAKYRENSKHSTTLAFGQCCHLNQNEPIRLDHCKRLDTFREWINNL